MKEDLCHFSFSKGDLGILFFFILLTCIFTFPLIVGFTTSIYGFSQYVGDPLGTLWWIWWYRYAWTSRIYSGFVNLVAYPFGLDWSAHPTSPLLDYPAAVFNFLTNNEILTYNLVILLGFILSAIFVFKLTNSIVKNTNASIIAGVIFAFCPNQLMQSAQHLGFAIPFWIIIYVLALYKLSININYKNIFFCSIAFSLVTLSNYYYGYFMAVFTLIWFGYMVLVRKTEFLNFYNIRILLLGILLGLLIITPFILFKPLIHNELKNIYAHEFKDLFKYAARWWDYFLPSEFHPVFGGWSSKIIDKSGGRHYFERSLYLGYTPLFFAGIAVFKWWKRDRRNILIPFIILTAVLFFVFSLSPVFQIGRVKIPNFSFFAYRFLPMFRVYARMGIVVILSIAILASYGLKYVLEGIRKKWSKRVVCGFSIIFVLFEFMNFPPFHNVDLSKTPKVYEWLAKEPEDVVIVEYPFTRNIEEIHSEYLFYQRVHKKKMINGAPESSLGDVFRKECRYPSKIETAKLLAYLGADYMIVHKDKYSHEEIETINKNPGLQFIRDFPDSRVYKIIAKPEDLITVFWSNFGSWEKWDNKEYWRWLGNNAKIWFGARESKTVDIKFKILSFAKQRELQIYVNEIFVKRLDVSSPSNSNLAQRVVLKNIFLQQGKNVIRFYTPQGEDRIGDILNNDDNRRVSFAISKFYILSSSRHRYHRIRACP